MGEKMGRCVRILWHRRPADDRPKADAESGGTVIAQAGTACGPSWAGGVPNRDASRLGSPAHATSGRLGLERGISYNAVLFREQGRFEDSLGRLFMRRVVITGLGALSPHGMGTAAFWNGLLEGKSSIGPLTRFDPSAFGSRIAGEIPPFKTTEYVPKSYRKATKIMARDIELAVVAADLAVRDAKLATKAVAGTTAVEPLLAQGWHQPDPTRVGCNIGAGLICADLNELTAAMVLARNPDNTLSLARWGRVGGSGEDLGDGQSHAAVAAEIFAEHAGVPRVASCTTRRVRRTRSRAGRRRRGWRWRRRRERSVVGRRTWRW